MICPDITRKKDWLLFDATLPGRGLSLAEGRSAGRHDVGLSAPALIASSASLSAGCKYALVGASELHLRSEAPAPNEPDQPSHIAAVQKAFAEADAATKINAPPNPHSIPDRSSDQSQTSPQDLTILCSEAGWLFEERSKDALVIDLGASGAYVPALLEARTSGISVEVNLVERPTAIGPRLTALAVFLLRLNGAFRMSRAVFREEHGESRAVLEASLRPDATPRELDLALGAIAVAARQCAAEARWLARDIRLARAFLNRCSADSCPAPEWESVESSLTEILRDPHSNPSHLESQQSSQTKVQSEKQHD